jgi:hypothetical protein
MYYSPTKGVNEIRGAFLQPPLPIKLGPGTPFSHLVERESVDLVVIDTPNGPRYELNKITVEEVRSYPWLFAYNFLKGKPVLNDLNDYDFLASPDDSMNDDYDAWEEAFAEDWETPNPPTRDRIKALIASYGEYDRIPCRVTPLCEPAKVRTISSGESVPYWISKKLNRVMVRALARHPTFCFTGRPATDSDFTLFSKEFLLSGDYKGATDTLDPVWSEYVLHAICRRIGASIPEYKNAISALTRHQLSYSHGTGGDKVTWETEQKTGQLMGSFISFPVLCIINAAVNWVYLDPTLDTPITELPLKINGDDVAASSDRDFSDWSQFVARVGFKLSLGKNYVHRSVFTINSEVRVRRKREHWTMFGLVPEFDRLRTINLGLIYSSDQAQNDKSPLARIKGIKIPGRDTGGGSLSANAYEFLDSLGLPNDHTDKRRIQAIDYYIMRNKSLLCKIKRNWFLPLHLGGVGIPITPYGLRNIPVAHRKLAASILRQPRLQDLQVGSLKDSADERMCSFAMSKAEMDWRTKTNEVVRWVPSLTKLKQRDFPIGLVGFLGYSACEVSIDTEQQDYRRILQGRSRTTLEPVSDQLLLEEALNPRRLVSLTRLQDDKRKELDRINLHYDFYSDYGLCSFVGR